MRRCVFGFILSAALAVAAVPLTATTTKPAVERAIVPAAAPSVAMVLTVTVAVANIPANAVLFALNEDYNLNPPYCHSHWIWDPLWYVYLCWLPDPPGSEGG